MAELTNSDLASIHEKLGRVLATTEQLRADFDRFNETSTEGRRRIYEAVEALDDRISDLEHEVALLTRTMNDEVMPAVGEMKRLKAMGLGYLGLAGLAGGSLTGGFIAFWDHLIRLLKGS